MHLYPIKMLGSHMDTISVSFPVNPRPDGGAPVNRHSKSPIDTTRALIGWALVLMTLNPFDADRMSSGLDSKYFIICTDKLRVIQIWFCKFVLWSYFLLIYVSLYPRESILTCSFWYSTNFFHQLSFAVLISSADTATRCNTQIHPNREISQCRSHTRKPLFAR